ncbi:MAG: hypothetical protein ACK422_00350, partial [Burkholderiales bacterium]
MKLSLHLLNAMGFVLVGTALTGCTTLLNMEDDTPPPPTPREVRQLTIPKDLAGNQLQDTQGRPIPSYTWMIGSDLPNQDYDNYKILNANSLSLA